MDVKLKLKFGSGGFVEATDAITLAKPAGGTWYRHFGLALYPVCQQEKRRNQRALSIVHDGERLLLYCHKIGCSFREILVAPGQFDCQTEHQVYLEKAGIILFRN